MAPRLAMRPHGGPCYGSRCDWEAAPGRWGEGVVGFGGVLPCGQLPPLAPYLRAYYRLLLPYGQFPC